jgi:hypothetical protein
VAEQDQAGRRSSGLFSAITSGRSTILQHVHTPLGFFVLIALVAETFIAMIAIFAHLPEWATIMFIGIGLLLIFLIVLGVFALVVWRPSNLVFSEYAHLRVQELRFESAPTALTQTTIESLPTLESYSDPAPVLTSPDDEAS